MTEREILKILKSNGWKITEGGNHHLATNPQKPGVKIPIPRHRGDILIGTANNILKAAGLK
ncbi:type II toxin-antitoxin system HicA family toxin [Anaerotruncus rubiinfantis]|uniref:type II toxin-antitoxin system HicA family toxin n=1 Tax=Anaerotruncus rubiinfantis TaxID=1720200 RepID=UPI001896FA40|nr:type II toxin-antitoxin system HicA family toxin [Anaerotruncus rubiinfantis]